MDAYNLKKDNRRKFYDKQKLKHRHATKSDIKYRQLNKEEKTKEVEIENEPLPSNEDRYSGDILYVPPDQDPQLQITSKYANKIIKQKLLSEKHQTDEKDKEATTSSLNIHAKSRTLRGKDIMQMDVDSLNEIIKGDEHENLKDDSTIKEIITSGDNTLEDVSLSNSKSNNKNRIPINMDISESFVPADLKEDEAFLDQLL